MDDAVELNITRYLIKPFVGEDLLGALEKVIESNNDEVAEITDSLKYQKDEKLLLHNDTSISIKGTSIKTPTTVAKAAPEDKPKRMTAVAIATSK